MVKPGGVVVTVSPGPRHLYQLKEQVYQQVQLHAEQDEQFDGFECERKEALAYTMTLPGAQAANLLQMTPFAACYAGGAAAVGAWRRVRVRNGFRAGAVPTPRLTGALSQKQKPAAAGFCR